MGVDHRPSKNLFCLASRTGKIAWLDRNLFVFKNVTIKVNDCVLCVHEQAWATRMLYLGGVGWVRASPVRGGPTARKGGFAGGAAVFCSLPKEEVCSLRKRKLWFCFLFLSWAINAWLLGIVHVRACAGVRRGEQDGVETAVSKLCVHPAYEPLLSLPGVSEPCCGTQQARAVSPLHKLQALPLCLLSPDTTPLHHPPFCKNWSEFLIYILLIVLIFSGFFPFWTELSK